MRVCVFIMSTDAIHSQANTSAMRDTFVKIADSGVLNNEYVFVEYMCDGVSPEYPIGSVRYETPYESKSYYVAYINDIESIYRTFEKTISVFKTTLSGDFGNFDWVIRINISNFLNIRLIDHIIGMMQTDVVYCNRINTIIDANVRYTNQIYPRGDMIMFGIDVFNKLLPHTNDFIYNDMSYKSRIMVDHIDDVLFGLCLLKTYGTEYVNKIIPLKYNFIPGSEINENEISNKCISSRVKTIPPNVEYSGYSWDYNEYRDFDSKKMFKLNEVFESQVSDIENAQLSDIFVDQTSVNDSIAIVMKKCSLIDLKKVAMINALNLKI